MSTRPDIYSTPEALRSFKNLKPESLGLQFEANPQDALLDLLREYLEVARDHIEKYTGRNFNAEVENAEIDKVPAAVEMVAKRIGANCVSVQRAQMKGDLVKVSEYTEKLFTGRVFGDDLKGELDPYVKAEVVSKGRVPFRMVRLKSRRELEGYSWQS